MEKLINSFTAIDFETASAAFYSACSIGIVRYENNEITHKKYFLIQPPDNHYNINNICIHGIKPEDTADADFFPVIWEKIKSLFLNTCIVAHNASFDMKVLKTTLNYYDIEQPSFLYMDSMQISGLSIPRGEKIKKSLDVRCKYFNISLPNHHNALCDAEACGQLVLCAFNNSRYKNLHTFVKRSVNLRKYDDVTVGKLFGLSRYNKISIKEIAASVDVENTMTNINLLGKVFVFTGELKKLVREQAYKKVIMGGGRVSSAVNRKVDYLVNAGTVLTSKVKNALELQNQGHHIKIITDDEFMSMLNDC